MFFVLATVTIIDSIAFAIYVNACAFGAFELFRFANCGIDSKYPIRNGELLGVKRLQSRVL